jgi:hypothetical protein
MNYSSSLTLNGLYFLQQYQSLWVASVLLFQLNKIAAKNMMMTIVMMAAAGVRPATL